MNLARRQFRDLGRLEVPRISFANWFNRRDAWQISDHNASFFRSNLFHAILGLLLSSGRDNVAASLHGTDCNGCSLRSDGVSSE